MSLTVTVIIPTYNAAKCLAKLLPCLASQSVDFELLIVDSSSADSSIAIAEKYTDHIRTIAQKEFDHGGTRTFACTLTHSDILVFMTQDALPCNEHAIERLVQEFEDPDVGVAYGRQIAYEHSGTFGRFLRMFNYPEHSNKRTYEDKKNYGLRAAFVSNSFCAYRRSDLEKIGYFEDNLIMSEDMFAAANLLRSGKTVSYVADAKVYHSHDYTLLEEFRRYFDIGVFHALKPELQEEFGSAAGEGKRFVKEELQYLLSIHQYHLLPLSFLRNGTKLLAYKLGKKYNSIPERFIPILSMHRSWWK